MLTHLNIRDLAVVAALEIDLSAGLTVLTGETGAGKSIIVDALQLVTGGRGGAELVRHGAERAEVVATFDTPANYPALTSLLQEQSIPADDEVVLRRVVTRDGKSRGYVNGQQLPLQILRQVGSLLLDIHGQHEFQSLVRANEQRALLDRYGDHAELAQRVMSLHRSARQLLAEAQAATTNAEQREARIELLRFQVSEIESLQLGAQEPADLLEERRRLAHRGKLAEATAGALQLLYESDEASAHALGGKALALLRSCADLDPRLAQISGTVDEAVIRTREAARDLASYVDCLDLDPARLEWVEQRLAAIEAIARKHRVAPAELLTRFAELSSERNAIEQIEGQLEALRQQSAAAAASWTEQARELSARRATAGARLAESISARMQTLGMTGGRLEVSLTPIPVAAGATAVGGLEEVEFLVSANPGQPLRSIAKVASGGELSRLSLAVQVAIATEDAASETSANCMVFDEVDAGIGGAVAQIVGQELAQLGRRAQVLCVTHLAQVASQAAHHLRVVKLTDGKTTRTTVSSLNQAEQVEEVARMIGGVEISDTAREHAREMLDMRDSVAGVAEKQSSRGARRKRGRTRA